MLFEIPLLCSALSSFYGHANESFPPRKAPSPPSPPLCPCKHMKQSGIRNTRNSHTPPSFLLQHSLHTFRTKNLPYFLFKQKEKEQNSEKGLEIGTKIKNGGRKMKETKKEKKGGIFKERKQNTVKLHWWTTIALLYPSLSLNTLPHFSTSPLSITYHIFCNRSCFFFLNFPQFFCSHSGEGRLTPAPQSNGGEFYGEIQEEKKNSLLFPYVTDKIRGKFVIIRFQK